jgi:hypothetical protein
MTGRVVRCPIDEMNKPRGPKRVAPRIPPTDAEIAALFAWWRQELVGCRTFAPSARDYVAAKLIVAGRAAGQRGPHSRSGRREVGAGPVRHAARAGRSRRSGQRPSRADGAADRQRGPHGGLVHRGRVGPLR